MRTLEIFFCFFWKLIVIERTSVSFANNTNEYYYNFICVVIVKWLLYLKKKIGLSRTSEMNFSLASSLLLPHHNLSHCWTAYCYFDILSIWWEGVLFTTGKAQLMLLFCYRLLFLTWATFSSQAVPLQDRYCSFCIALQLHWKTIKCSVIGVTKLSKTCCGSV